MVMIGIDPHKRTHTAVAIDTHESVLGERLVHASGTQVPELLEWAKRLDGGERTKSALLVNVDNDTLRRIIDNP